MLRILHVVPWLEASVGGPPVVAQALAAAQARAGHEVRLASYAPAARPGGVPGGVPYPGREVNGTELPDLFGLPAVPHAEKLRVHLLPHPGRLRRAFGWGARRWFERELPPPDVTHLHGMWVPPLLAAAAARGRGGKYVVVPHGMLDPWSLAQKRLKKRVAMALAFRRYLDGAAFLHALNADEADLIRPLGLRCPVEVIPNGVFPEQVADLPRPARSAPPGLNWAPALTSCSSAGSTTRKGWTTWPTPSRCWRRNTRPPGWWWPGRTRGARAVRGAGAGRGIGRPRPRRRPALPRRQVRRPGGRGRLLPAQPAGGVQHGRPGGAGLRRAGRDLRTLPLPGSRRGRRGRGRRARRPHGCRGAGRVLADPARRERMGAAGASWSPRGTPGRGSPKQASRPTAGTGWGGELQERWQRQSRTRAANNTHHRKSH